MTKTKEEAENNKKNITNLSSSDLANRVDGLKNKMKVEIFFPENKIWIQTVTKIWNDKNKRRSWKQ